MNKKITLAVLSSLMLVSTSAFSSGNKTYHVTITNLTNATVFTPILVASHRHEISLFELGAPASPGLTAIAEGSVTSVLETTMAGTNGVVDMQKNGWSPGCRSIGNRDRQCWSWGKASQRCFDDAADQRWLYRAQRC